MKTRCPNCQTTFRVTPEQLKARAGKVRCGQCQAVFNALDSLLDEPASRASAAISAEPTDPPVDAESLMPLDFDFSPIETEYRPHQEAPAGEAEPEAEAEAEEDAAATEAGIETSATPLAETSDEVEEIDYAEAEEADEAPAALSDDDAQELGKATGLILPRETSKIPGYSKWSEEALAGPLSLPAEAPARWPFIVAALLLVVVLAGQIAFRFRGELAVTMPALTPALTAFAALFDADIPLPRHVELVSIEASDLQKDAARGNLLVLNATLRNRANYGQAYPSLELSLTDTDDTAIARRVFAPAEYLSPKLRPDQPFKPNADIAVRLWIEVKDVPAAGYRLYVFYP